MPGFALKRAPLAGYCRSPEFENRLTVEKQAVRCGFSTRSVLLPESLWVCPFGGVAAWMDEETCCRRTLPTRARNLRDRKWLVKSRQDLSNCVDMVRCSNGGMHCAGHRNRAVADLVSSCPRVLVFRSCARRLRYRLQLMVPSGPDTQVQSTLRSVSTVFFNSLRRVAVRAGDSPFSGRSLRRATCARSRRLRAESAWLGTVLQ